jgi:hypothetical protein
MFIAFRKTDKDKLRKSVMALMVNRHMFEHGRQEKNDDRKENRMNKRGF